MHPGVRVEGHGGVTLVADVVGPDRDPAVLLLHGGGQTRRSWVAAADTLARHGWCAVAVDLRGHGESDWPADGDYGVDAFAHDVLRVASRWDRPAVVGASLGGLVSLLAVGEMALDVRALVLVDVSLRPSADGVSRIRGFMAANPEGFASVAEAAEAVSRYLPHREPPRDLGGLAQNLRRSPDGRYRWHWDPRFLAFERVEALAVRERLRRAARNVTVPTLLVRGQNSEILDEDGTQDLLGLLPSPRLVVIPEAHHMVAGDDNDRFGTAVGEFLAEVR